MLSIAGAQVPEIAFCEVVGKAGIFAPLQNGPTAAKVGVILVLMVMVKVVFVAH